jgi:hypothetical protein
MARLSKNKRSNQFVSRLAFETLETRRLLSASISPVAIPLDGTLADGSSTPPSNAFTPAQIDSAYGISSIKLNGIVGNGAGQTIAIVTADDDPNLVSSTSSSFATSDLHIFDKEFGLPDPTFTKIEEGSGASAPPADTGWSEEAALDVEWTHAIAPDASIDLVEADSASAVQLIGYGVATAADLPGVSVVSMSWGFGEFSGETSYDHYFTTPSGHAGVTFVASTGDTGAPGYYPAFSPNVVAVGGTSLTLSGNSYVSETGYSSSGGGLSNYEDQAGYQSGKVSQSPILRATPDVSFDGDPNTGVDVYDSYNGGYPGWYKIAGTSFSAPAWAGLIAIAGLSSLDGVSQTLPNMYSASSSDFHDITSGNNGYAAGPGYDLVTGRGTPIANLLEPAIAGVSATAASTGSISGTVSKVVSGSTSTFSGVTIYLDTNDNGTLDSGEPSTTTSFTGTFSFTGLTAGTYHLREVVPSGYTQTSPSSSPTTITVGTGAVTGENFTDTAVVTTTGSLLKGTVIGTSGSYDNDGNTIAKAFDANLSTFFDGPTANGNWAGLNLSSEYKITSISYAPRSGWASRMVGGIFQGSNDSTFATGVTNLATISTAPVVGSYTTISISSSSAFQYVRYLGPSGSYGDVADIEFYGTASSTTATKLTGTVIGTSGSYQNDGNTIAKAVDGSLTTFFDGPTANGNWVGLDLGSAQTITQISYAPRASWASRMVGGIFQASNSSTFSTGVVNLYTISATPVYNTLTTVSVSVSGTYRYVRYLSPSGSFGDVAEIDFYG